MKHKKNITVKFIWSISILLLIVLTLSLWFEIKTYKDVEKMTAALDKMQSLIDTKKYEDVLSEYYSIQKLWNSHKDHWYYYLNHTVIKETDLCVARIGAYVESKQYGDALAEKAALIRLLHEVKSHDLPLIHNII